MACPAHSIPAMGSLCGSNKKAATRGLFRPRVAVVSSQKISNAYEHLATYQEMGMLRILAYEKRSDAQRSKDRQMLLCTIKRLSLIQKPSPLGQFIQEQFPELWAYAKSTPFFFL